MSAMRPRTCYDQLQQAGSHYAHACYRRSGQLVLGKQISHIDCGCLCGSRVSKPICVVTGASVQALRTEFENAVEF
eukprot:1481847-Amphidinium_carterae.3